MIGTDPVGALPALDNTIALTFCMATLPCEDIVGVQDGLFWICGQDRVVTKQDFIESRRIPLQVAFPGLLYNSRIYLTAVEPSRVPTLLGLELNIGVPTWFTVYMPEPAVVSASLASMDLDDKVGPPFSYTLVIHAAVVKSITSPVRESRHRILLDSLISEAG